MTYATSNPPVRVWGTVAGASGWYYTDADVDSDVDATDYFSNGDALGMAVGDVLYDFDTAGVMTLMFVSAVTAGGAATVTAATVTV
jgi:hypothetical protein